MAEVNKGVRSEIMGGEIVMRDGKPYRRTEFYIDYGPKLGRTHVITYDPCITEEAQQKRREAIVRKCQELIASGHM